MAAGPTAYQFEFSGGAVCLDFANTLGDRPRGRQEHLAAWTDLVAWGEQAGLLSARAARALRAQYAARPGPAGRALARALDLRECLYRVFHAQAAGEAPAAADLDRLNAWLAAAMPHARLERQDGTYRWGWTAGDPSIDRLLWPVVRSAADLVVSDERASVRECASDTCSWLFIDRSRTKRRRWCSMTTCGNRAKARRFYQRQVGGSRT